MKPVIIIPALNPDEKLIALVENLNAAGLQVVVVNDGSEDSCLGVFEAIRNRLQCDVRCHLKNLGKGAALKTGIRYASAKYPECSGYVTADADGQHAAEDIIKVSHMLDKNQYSLILGARDFNGNNIPFKSKWGNRITSLVFLLSTGQRCPDTQTGLRGIPRNFTEICLYTPGDRFEYEMNLLLKCGKTGISFMNVPISTIYIEGNRSSHFSPVRDSIAIYLNIFKYSLSSLVSAAIDLSLFTVFISFLFGKSSAGILAATFIARCVSGVVNFMLNKHWVFQSRSSHCIEGMKYFSLFCCQMTMSWLLVSSLSPMNVHITLIKILVDTTLFFASYMIQKNHIFSRNGKDARCHEKILIKTL